jgi:hypothetical protein
MSRYKINQGQPATSAFSLKRKSIRQEICMLELFQNLIEIENERDKKDTKKTRKENGNVLA